MKSQSRTYNGSQIPINPDEITREQYVNAQVGMERVRHRVRHYVSQFEQRRKDEREYCLNLVPGWQDGDPIPERVRRMSNVDLQTVILERIHDFN